ncbi:MAG: ATP-dependent DNA helicase [Acidobacteria bacterium]|nr:ATP-dependent DNA helicase [Acidobacteriota bacterium]
MSRTSLLLEIATGALDATERRPGQVSMAEAVAAAIESGRHAVITAGTGTGKTLAYLVPVVASGRRAVVATATKALQDQIASRDLPHVVEALADELGRTVTWSVLKGRSNYLCLQRLDELQSRLETEIPARDLERLVDWAGRTDSGDVASVDWPVSEIHLRHATVGADECPGATRCPRGADCFAERARDRAAESEVVVVNLHLYGLDLASDGMILPEHDVVVVDEAHQLEDVTSAAAGSAAGPGAISACAAAVRGVIRDATLDAGLAGAAASLAAALVPSLNARLATPIGGPVRDALSAARIQVEAAASAVKRVPSEDSSVTQRAARASTSAMRLLDALDRLLEAGTDSVAFVSGTAQQPRLEVAPLDVGSFLQEHLWSRRTAVLTSATIPVTLPARLGLGPDDADVADVGSPFDYAEQALLYCARHLPDPRDPARSGKVHEEIERLIRAAGGRTLALFTSWRAMREAADHLEGRIPYALMRQDDLPKMALIEAFTDDVESCLFATQGFFQGVDVPGPALSLVIIDKIPFPRPDDPLLSARRDAEGDAAFSTIDIPLAATQLAQAAGRLIRNRTDHGVVAILDPRLATKGYGGRIVAALPPMTPTTSFDAVETFFRERGRR